MTDKESSPDANTPEAEAPGVDKVAKKVAPKKVKPDKGDLADLSEFSFGPAWAKEKPRKERSYTPRQKGSESGGKRPPRKYQSERKTGPKGDRGKKYGGRDRRQDQRDRAPSIAPPEGVKARIMPIEEGLDALAKQISDTGRTHSVFDLAWVVLGGLERFNMGFESEKDLLYQSIRDHSLWLSKKECQTHFWSSGAWKEFYEQEVTEIDPPSGNFQSVARCGISRELIGPPNHHAYQQVIMEFYHERFSNMPLDRYKQKIIMEHDEEVVQEWLESMKQHVCWRPKAKAEVEVEVEVDQPKPDDSETSEANVTEDDKPTKVEEGAIVLNSKQEVNQHFMSHGFEEEYKSSQSFYVRANMDTKLWNPSLLALQKITVSELRRYPGDLASILCRQMSGRHLAVFKWKKRLHCGPARPKHVPDDLVMADRPTALFKWVIEHPAGNIDAMWKELLPKDIDEKIRHTWYHDLHWLINEGYVLLFADGKLHAAKELEKAKAKQEKLPKEDQKSEMEQKPEKKDSGDASESNQSEK